MHVSCRMHVTQRDITGYLQIHTSPRIYICAMDLALTFEYGYLVMHALLLDKFLVLKSLKS